MSRKSSRSQPVSKKILLVALCLCGQSSNLDKAAQQLEKLDVPDDVEINASDKGVEVTFRGTVSFEQGSIEISKKPSRR